MAKQKGGIEAPPELGSVALAEYYWASVCDWRLFSFVIDSVLAGDYVAHVARRALDGHDADDITPADLAQKDPGVRTRQLRESRQELHEMFLGRAVDNFQTYIVDIIRTVLHKQPRILTARKQELTLGYILQFDSIEALTHDIIEGKVHALSYDGFGDLEEWCTSKGIPLIVPAGSRTRVVELIATRNLIVHSRGRIDERYINAAAASREQLGEKRTLEIDDVLDAIDLLNRVVTATDAAIVGKYDLERLSIRPELTRRSKSRWTTAPQGTDKKPMLPAPPPPDEDGGSRA
jgi:hypothetical protein